MVSFGILFLYLINPYLFSVPNSRAIGVLFIYVFLLTVFFPVLSIVLMKALGFLSSFQLKKRTDRIGPLICTVIFYLWLYINIFSNPSVPTAFTIFVLGSVIALFIAFFINNFSKISLHSIGAGGALTGALLIKFHFSYDYFTLTHGILGTYNISINFFIIIVILMAGLVMTSRLILKKHKPIDIYGGFTVGIFSQLLAIFFLI